MKKFILFCLSTCLVGMLLLGCPNGEEETTTTTIDYSNLTSAAPGTIEPRSQYFNTIIEAKKNLDIAEDEAVFFYYRVDQNYDDYTLYVWADGQGGAEVNGSYSFKEISGKKVAYMKFNSTGDSTNGCVPLDGILPNIINDKGTLKFIIKKIGTWDGQSPDLSWNLSNSMNFGTTSDTLTVLAVDENAKPLLLDAVMTDTNKIKLSLSQKYAVEPKAGYDNGFVIKSSGSNVVITDMYSSALSKWKSITEERRQKNNFSKELIIIVGDISDYEDLYISHPSFLPTDGIKVVTGVIYKKNASAKSYDKNDLGLTLSGSTAAFKVFAPIATEANVLLYSDWNDAKSDIDNAGLTKKQTTSDTLTNGTRVAMSKASDFDTTGVWEVSNVDVSGKNYYVYELDNLGSIYRVCDINAFVAAPDSIAAQIIDIDDSECQPTGWETEYTNPFGNNGTDTKAYTEAIIYEMHIRDWSRAFNANSTGKFDDITTALGTNGDGVLGQHLKDLGITHVQILPMFDYAQTNSDSNYNWGYNPYHYNVPEGRYVNNHDNGGTEAVKQMRAMIKAFHDAGIAVNMDVVYNHTSGTGTGSLYDMTVPYYYYRLSSGKYSNGSGCGNETDSSMPMYRKYMIDSLSHWMRDYHINGFRFDLMGLHEAETMEAVYTALSEIDKNVMVYGEPWTGGTSPVKNGATKAGAVSDAGYGAFDDSFRDGVKGKEFGGFNKGQVQGNYNDGAILEGLKGDTTARNDTGIKGLSIHYAECHDNYTLFDKLIYSTMSSTSGEIAPLFNAAYTAVMSNDNSLDLVKRQDKLAASYIILSQGTPFMNGGQEFLRTKKGDPDSYAADTKGGITWTNETGVYNIDSVNTIDLSFKTKYSDVYNVYKGLIALRHSSDAFTAGKSVTATTQSEGVTKYTVKGSSDEFCVYFNATSANVNISTTGYSKVIDITDGTLQESATLPTSVRATDFVILKK